MLGHRKPISLPDASSQLAFPALDSLGAGNQLACLTFGWDWKSDEPQSDRELARKWESECASKQVHIHKPTYFDYGSIHGSIYGTVNGTIAGSTFVAGSSESSKSKRDREKDLNNEINNYFQSPSERQSSNLFLRKSEIEQDISNETDNEKGEADHELQDDADSDWIQQIMSCKCLLFSPHLLLKEVIDDQEEVKEKINNKEVAKENQKGPFRMRRIVEEELFKLGNDLEFEHAIHSFILDIEDELIMEHFTVKELEEIESATIPEVPELSNEIDDFLGKFLGKTNLNEIRQMIKESMFGNDYNRGKHHDVDYICLALYSLVREIENGNLKNTNLENWYNCHIWNIIFDQAFGDIMTVAVVRGESTSVSTATRKNKKVKRKSGERRKIGRRGDWILRAIGNGNKDEFGAGETGRMNMGQMRKNIQTVGIIHEGLMMSLVYADNPKGYVCRFRRCDLMEVPDIAEKFDSILIILASVLNAKSAIRETIRMTQTKGQTIKSFKSVGFRKRPRDEDHQMSACLSTPKKAKVCAKVNDERPYPVSPCPGSPNSEPLI
ncbi:12439_t:CDS:10 [Ambispora gerdemannii]|uniref:12439_t:CDS:1 n=1 Tax=Ambispora gerdemannii TaxID=144530 RepID=A0A9N9FJG8_9GLOM|nr:12439_t:CDS:10 [Ambispora gerdemannii]